MGGFSSRCFLSPLCLPSSRHLLSPLPPQVQVRAHRLWFSLMRPTAPLRPELPPSSEWRPSESELCTKTCSDRWLYLSFVSFDVDADHVYKLRVSKCGCFLRDSQETSDMFSSKKSHVNVIVPYTLTSFYEPSDLFDIMNPIYCFNFFFCFIFKNKYWAGCGAAVMKPCGSKLWNNCIFTCTLQSRSSCLRSGRCHEVWRHFDSRQLMVRSHCTQSSVARWNNVDFHSSETRCNFLLVYIRLYMSWWINKMMVADSNNLINNFGRHENSCMIVSGNVFCVTQ